MLASAPTHRERKGVFEEFKRGLFHGDPPRAREGASSVDFVVRGRVRLRAGLIERVFCRSIGRRGRIGD